MLYISGNVRKHTLFLFHSVTKDKANMDKIGTVSSRWPKKVYRETRMRGRVYMLTHGAKNDDVGQPH